MGGDVEDKNYTMKPNLAKQHQENDFSQLSNIVQNQKQQSDSDSFGNVNRFPPHGHFQYQCHDCQAHFRGLRELEKHIELKHGNSMFECEKCFKKFANRSNLNRHLQFSSICGLPKNHRSRFSCNICYKTFGRKDTLKEHLQVTHKIPRYQCKICREKFDIKKNFHEHRAFCMP